MLFPVPEAAPIAFWRAQRVVLSKHEPAAEDELTLSKKRWIVMSAGILANACMGAGYAFSVFRNDLVSVLGCTPQQASFAFSLSFVFLPVGMLACGWIVRRFGSRAAVTTGGLVFGLGTVAAGFSQSISWLYLTYGAMVSVGNGITYAAVVATAVRWFPERKGLAGGLVVGALGAGTLVISYAGQAMLGQGTNVLDAIKILGLCYIMVGLFASRFISDPPKGYAPVAASRKAKVEAAGPTNDFVWQQMIAQPYFWLMFVVYVCGTFPGLMLISQAKDVAKEVTKLDLAAAAGMVGMLGASNAVGRMLWGAVSDRIGRLNSLTAMLAVTALVMFFMPGLLGLKIGLIIGFVATGLCFGGCLGTFPSVCADAFGSRNIEVNYAVLFVAFSVAGVAGPVYGAQLHEVSGGYNTGFMAAATAGALGVALSIVSRFFVPRRKADCQS